MCAIGIGENKGEAAPPRSAQPTRPSPGLFFWLVGPITLVVLAMFAASPQCVLDPRFSCSSNWVLNDSQLSVWPLDAFWLKLARVTLLIALVICLWSLIYHLYLVTARVTSLTPYVFMGFACTILIPAALYLMVAKMFGQHDMMELGPPLALAPDDTYRLFSLGTDHGYTFLLSHHVDGHLFVQVGDVLGSASTTGAPLESSFVILSSNCESLLLPSRSMPYLCQGGNGRWIVAILPPNQLILALDKESKQFLSGPLVESLSPFMLVDDYAAISEMQRSALLSLTQSPNERGEKLPGIDSLWTGLSHPNAQARALLASLLSRYSDDRREALSILQSLASGDKDNSVRSIASQVIEQHFPHEKSPGTTSNFLDQQRSDLPAVGAPE